MIAVELGAKLRATSAPAIEHKGTLASLLTTLTAGDVLFIDEIHRLKIVLQEVLYTSMEDGVLDLAAGAKVIRVPLQKFTLIGATTHAGMLSAPLLDRFGFCFHLRYYDVPDLATIVMQSAAMLQIAIDRDAAIEIARRSRGTPRLANRLLRRVRDFMLGSGEADGHAVQTIVARLVVAAASKLGVDCCGLDSLDRAYLAAVSKGPIGIEEIANTLSEQPATIADVVEPFMLQLGFVARTVRGRVLTAAGLAHLRTNHQETDANPVEKLWTTPAPS